jgi:holo-[acyl-carrier protein] synthase
VSWQEIEVRSDEKKAPYVVLSGEGERLAKQLGLKTWSLSLSHTESQAMAFVVAAE